MHSPLSLSPGRFQACGRSLTLSPLLAAMHSKLDRASMLDEAIRYMKTLQMQLQIMSGGGRCQAPITSPAAMQCLYTQLSPISPVGPRFGMGFGYGMGMTNLDFSVAPPLAPIPLLPAQSFIPIPGFGAIQNFNLSLPMHQMPFAPIPESHAALATTVVSDHCPQPELLDSTNLADKGFQ